MSWTKRQLVIGALEEIGIASFEYDLQADELQSALKRLDVMMAEWNSRGVRIGYPLVSNPENSELDSDSNVPDSAVEAIMTNLAMKLAPSYGREVSRETKTSAKNGLTNQLREAGVLDPVEKQFSGTLPLGQGNKYHNYQHRNFFGKQREELYAGPDSKLEL